MVDWPKDRSPWRGLLFARILLFVVLVGHVGWDDPDRLQYVTADIWFDILV